MVVVVIVAREGLEAAEEIRAGVGVVVEVELGGGVFKRDDGRVLDGFLGRERFEYESGGQAHTFWK